MDQSLSNPFGLDEDVLNFFRSNILTLRKLEDVLCSVDDFDRSIWVYLANVSTMKPSTVLEGLSSLFRVEEIARHDRSTEEANLTLWIRFISMTIVHFWNVLQAYLDVMERTSDMACNRVT